GSSDLLRFQGAPDSLAGRALTVPLSGFSQGELRDHVDDFAATVRAGHHHRSRPRPVTRRDIVNMVVAGGYPDLPVSDRLHQTWFDGYVERILRVDAADIRRGADSDRLAT